MTCDLNPTDDQRQILEAASRMLERHYPLARLRHGAPDALDEIAAFGLFAADADSGFTTVEEALVHVLLGRHLVTPRALAAPLAARFARAIGQTQLADALSSARTGVALGRRAGRELLLVDPAGAGLALVFGWRRLELVEVSGAEAQTEQGLGGSLALARCAASRVRLIASSESPALLDLADLLVGAQLLGAAEAARDLAVAHARVRQQFGRPIGAFQAIKHHCANMAIGVEMVSAQLDMAAIALRDGHREAPFQVAALRLLAPRVAYDNARLCIQIHGGIGFSAEADAHRIVAQVHVLRQLGGGADLLKLPAPLAGRT